MEYGTYFPYIPQADESWSNEDVTATRNFFQSQTGRRLALRLRNFALRTAWESALRPEENRAGTAGGMILMIKHLEAHSEMEE